MKSELAKLVEYLEDSYSEKEQELRVNPNFDSHVDGALQNRRQEIRSFKIATNNPELNPIYKDEIIKNFTADAKRIKSELDKIACG